MVASVIAVILGIALGVLISGSLTRPLNEGVRITKLLAEGDLTAKSGMTSNDETGQLLKAMAVMTERLKAVVEDVKSAGHNVAAGRNTGPKGCGGSDRMRCRAFTDTRSLHALQRRRLQTD